MLLIFVMILFLFCLIFNYLTILAFRVTLCTRNARIYNFGVVCLPYVLFYILPSLCNLLFSSFFLLFLFNFSLLLFFLSFFFSFFLSFFLSFQPVYCISLVCFNWSWTRNLYLYFLFLLLFSVFVRCTVAVCWLALSVTILNLNHNPCSLFYIERERERKRKREIENGHRTEGEYTENVFGCPRVDFVVVGEFDPPRVVYSNFSYFFLNYFFF
jgi:hypothetical protein